MTLGCLAKIKKDRQQNAAEIQFSTCHKVAFLQSITNFY